MHSLSGSEKLRGLLVAIFTGIFFGQYPYFTAYLPFAILLSGILGIVWKKYGIWILCTFCIGLLYGQWRNDFDFRNDQLPSYTGETLCLSGTVTSFPDLREKNTRAIVSSSLGRFLLITTDKKSLNYGNKITVCGLFTKPRNFSGFDYQSYLRRFGVQTILQNPDSLEFLNDSGGSFLLKTASQVRLFFAHNLQKSLPSPHSTIAMGVLLGVKNELPDFLQTDFKQSGLQHLLVVSGFNVTVVLLCIAFLFHRLGRRIVFVMSLGALIFFVAMTGAEAPVLRAALMGGTVAWATCMGRFSDARSLVLFSMTLIGIVQPRIVQSDIGFFLSSGATLGIILGVPVLERCLQWIPNKLELRTMLSVTLSAQIAVFPILGLYFGNFPFVGVLSNLFAEPVIPFSMAFSFLSACGGVLPETLAKVLGIPAFLLIQWLLEVAHFFGQIPPLPIPKGFSQFSLVLMVGYFLWAIFSRWFSKTFFEKSELQILDFSTTKPKNPDQ